MLPSADKSELALSDNDLRLHRLSQYQSMSSTVLSTPYDMIPLGEGALPYINQWTCAGLKGRVFLRPFGMKTSIDFASFGLESGMVFEGTAPAPIP